MTNPEKHLLDQASDSLFQYDRWRISFLNIVLRVTVALGFGLLLVNIPAFKGPELAIFSITYVVLLVVTFAPLPYSIKAGTLVIVGYFIGTYSIMQNGPWTDATVYYLGITLFASLLFDERLDRWVFAINVITIFSIGILNLLGRFTLSETEFPSPVLTDWISYIANYIVFAVSITWAINLLKNEFKSIAGQFQSALTFLSKDRSELETRVNERTAGLIKKTEQLRAASYITRQTAEVQDLESVLNLVVNLLSDQFGFYHAGILLMNEAGDETVLQTASSDGGKRMMEKGYSVKVGSKSTIGLSASEKKPRIALDEGTDSVFFDNPDLPNTHSQLVLPLLVHDKVLGILDIQSDQPQAFNMEDIDVLQTLADQIAVAIDNMRLLEDAQTALTQVEALTTVRTREAWSQKAKDGNYTYTYTPLGMRPGKAPEASEESDQTVKVPITLRGQKIGTISLTRKNKTTWNDVDLDMVDEVAYQTGLAVDNVRLVEEATERAQQEQTVGELAARFSQSADIDSLLQTAARELGQVTDVAEVSVYIGEIPEQAPQKKRANKRASA